MSRLGFVWVGLYLYKGISGLYRPLETSRSDWNGPCPSAYYVDWKHLVVGREKRLFERCGVTVF